MGLKKINLVTAKIAKDSYGKGLWIRIEHDNPVQNIDIAVSEDEIKPIMKACGKYLNKIIED